MGGISNLRQVIIYHKQLLEDSPSSFQQAKTADVYYRAMIAKAKLKKMTGETIDRKKAGMHAFNLGRSLRDLFVSFPTRYGALIAADLETDEHKTVVVLDEYVRKLLCVWILAMQPKMSMVLLANLVRQFGVVVVPEPVNRIQWLQSKAKAEIQP